MNGDFLTVGNADNANTFIQTRSSAGQISGIKITRGAGDWSSAGNNNFGIVVSDNGIELSKFTALGQNVTGRAPYLTIADGGNATFAGNITVSNASPSLTLTDTDNSSNIDDFSSVGNVRWLSIQLLTKFIKLEGQKNLELVLL